MVLRKNICSLLLVIVCCLEGFSQSFDTSKSNVIFQINKLIFQPVKGIFSGMTGSILFDSDNLSSSFFNVCIDAGSINTSEPARDTHLKSEEFFDVKNFPLICFTSKSVSKIDNGFSTHGDLNIKGKTQPAEIVFQHTNNLLQGQLSVNRFDFELGTKSFKSTLLIAAIAKISIYCYLK